MFIPSLTSFLDSILRHPKTCLPPVQTRVLPPADPTIPYPRSRLLGILRLFRRRRTVISFRMSGGVQLLLWRRSRTCTITTAG